MQDNLWCDHVLNVFTVRCDVTIRNNNGIAILLYGLVVISTDLYDIVIGSVHVTVHYTSLIMWYSTNEM